MGKVMYPRLAYCSAGGKIRSNDPELGLPELGLISCLEVVQNTE
jgi:hypothetical protein